MDRQAPALTFDPDAGQDRRHSDSWRAPESNATAAQPQWLFIVGAPRCGTTSLARYLKDHSEVCFSRIKEPHFFSQKDLRHLAGIELSQVVRDQYVERYFPDRRPSRVMAEASVTYLYMPEQIEPILRLWPEAKFVIALRNPLELVPSLHQRLLHIGDETVRDFRRAWELVPERRAGRALPARCADARWLDYWEAGRLGHHVEKFLATVGRERCFLSVFDDFVADPAKQYRQLLAFAGLSDDGRTHFGCHRGSSGFKIGWLQRLLKRPPKPVISLFANDAYRERFEGREPPELIAPKVRSIRKKLLRWNRAPARRPNIDADLLNEMRSLYREDVALLSSVVGRDLSHWIDP